MRQHLTIDAIKDRLLAQLDSVVARFAPPAPGSYTKMGLYFTLNPGRADRSVGSFCIHLDGPKAGRWNDFATGEHGDVIDLIGLSLGFSDPVATLAAARAFLGLDTESPELRRAREIAAEAARQRRAAQERDRAAKALARRKLAHAVWLSAQERIAGTPVDHYLRGRGIDLSLAGRQPRALRFHPECLYFEERTDPETGEVTTRRLKLPAMVAAIVNGQGDHIATHRTYLAIGPGGRWSKAAVPDAKKVLGDYRGGTIRLSSGIGPRGGKGASLSQCPPGSRVLMAEGIETALSAVILRPEARVLAAVSLSNMAAAELPGNVADLVLISDGDDHPQAVAAFGAAVEAHAKAGRTVRVWRSDVPGEDLNDALQRAQETKGAA